VPDVEELLLRARLKPEDLPEGSLDSDKAYADALYLLTRMPFSVEEAKCFWSEIVQHHTGLTAALGRDIGIRVAICDYFETAAQSILNHFRAGFAPCDSSGQPSRLAFSAP
jgi:hypothetical protein